MIHLSTLKQRLRSERKAIRHAEQQLQQVHDALSDWILGKPQELSLSIMCLVAGGHLLVEGPPGMGKTTLAKALGAAFGLQTRRVQFTSDLLPADLLGVSVFNPAEQSFRFHPGPVFSQLLLADELNRATARTQSALLEAMEEGQVSIDGDTHALPTPFFVIATQNPSEQTGTFPLPESQLDRFMMRLPLSHPDPAAERKLLRHPHRRQPDSMQPILSNKDLLHMRGLADSITLSDALLDYVQQLIAGSRNPALFATGLSTRGGQTLLRCARIQAMMQGRDMVLPEDIQLLVPYVMGHRLHPANADTSVEEQLKLLLEQVPAH